MFGIEPYWLLMSASFPCFLLLCLVLLKRYKVLIRATIGIGLLGILHAFWAAITGQIEASGIGLIAAAVGLGLAAIAESQAEM